MAYRNVYVAMYLIIMVMMVTSYLRASSKGRWTLHHLSKSRLLKLGMLKIDLQGTLIETSELRIKITVKTPQDSIGAVLNNYSHTFQWIGCFQDKKEGKKREVKLEVDPNAEPVAQKPCPVPYHLQKALKEWLDQGVKEEMFEKVPDGETIT